MHTEPKVKGWTKLRLGQTKSELSENVTRQEWREHRRKHTLYTLRFA